MIEFSVAVCAILTTGGNMLYKPEFKNSGIWCANYIDCGIWILFQ